MRGQDALTLVDRLLQAENLKRKLNDVQSVVFLGTWSGCTYTEIADQLDYQLDYIKQVGSQLWRSLSQKLGEPVSKRNIQAVLRRYQQSQQTTITSPITQSQQHWKEAIDVSQFYSRQEKLQILEETWIKSDLPNRDSYASRCDVGIFTESENKLSAENYRYCTIKTIAKKVHPVTLTTAKCTVEDYHRMIADGILSARHVELLNGEIIEISPEEEYHAYSSDEAGEYLIYLLGDRAKVREAKPITLPQSNSEPKPDIAIVQRLGRDYRQHHPYPENIFWLIEYSNFSLNKDLEVKTKIYAAANISEYWVINLQTAQLIVFRAPTPEGYQSQSTLTQGEINPLAFPDVAVSIERLIGN
jgi:Uma2 family endonuclease